MKRLLLSLAIVSLLALPAMAEVSCWSPPAQQDGCVGISVQGYVDGTANYQTGCVNQCDSFKGIKTVCDDSFQAQCTNFGASQAGCNNNCSLGVSQSKFSCESTKTTQVGCFDSKVDGKYAVGSADMSTLAGVGICSAKSNDLSGCASASNFQHISQSATNAPCFSGCYANANYCGTQSLNLNASYNK